MKFTAKERYGFRALVELASRYGKGPVALSEIARVQGLSLPYLEQVAAVLRRGGLLISQRGASGGYLLAHPPESITLRDAVRVLEGEISLLPCVDSQTKEIVCPLEPGCSRRDAWQALQSRMAMMLDQITLADLTSDRNIRELEDGNHGSAGEI